MLEIEFRRLHSVAILSLVGNIDIDAANFIEQIGWCLENEYLDILCDFENVNLVDYAGLSVLTIAYKNVLNHNARMKFVKVPAHVRKTLCLVCLDRVFEIYEDEDFALNSFKEDRIISEIQKKQLRRRFKRLDLDIDVHFRPSGRREEQFSPGKILNLSAVGMLVFSEQAYPLGEILDVRLALLPKPGVVELEAKVVWLVQKEIQPQIYPGMGMEFRNLDNQTQKKIVDFVERNLPLSSTSECL